MEERRREHQREKERRDRRKRKYGQAKLKHSKRGITSCILAALVLVILVSLIATAYVTEGKAAPVAGSLGLTAMVLAAYGLYLGIKGFKEREKDYLTCKIGSGFCAAFIIGCIILFCRGLF